LAKNSCSLTGYMGIIPNKYCYVINNYDFTHFL
jgi:hypothetical protein